MSSFGTGSHVRVPGAAANQPNVFSFATSYDEMYKTLVSRDKELYPDVEAASGPGWLKYIDFILPFSLLSDFFSTIHVFSFHFHQIISFVLCFSRCLAVRSLLKSTLCVVILVLAWLSLCITFVLV